jgi:hypothetical protein
MTHEPIIVLNMKEQEILHIATEKLAMLTGAVIREVKLEAGRADQGIDARIDIRLGNKNVHFLVEIKYELRNNPYPAIVRNKLPDGQHHLLICQYIPKPLKQELKDNKFNYLEAAGNCFIHTPDLFIYINDQQVTETRLPAEGKLWKTAGLKFLFAVLRNPEVLNYPYRRIAEEAGVALGNIGGLLDEMKNEGFLREGIELKKKTLFIEQRERLIQRWAEGFRTTLKPRLMMGTFRFINKENTGNWNNIPTGLFKWGGENAGALLTNFLTPEKFTLYTKEPKTVLMKMLQLVPDPNGNIEMLEQFWTDAPQAPEGKNGTVPPLLAYAELITSFDSRNRETAERIKLKYLD